MMTIRLLTESDDPLAIESGGFILQEAVLADLTASVSFAAEISVTSGFFLQTEAIADLSSAITTYINATSILEESSAAFAELNTQIKAYAQLAGEPLASSELLTQIKIVSSLSAVSATASALTAQIQFTSPLTALQEASGSITTQIKANASAQSESSVTANLRTSIDAFAAAIAVSNIGEASLQTGINLTGDLSLGIRLISEDGSGLLTEAGDTLIGINGEPTLSGILSYTHFFQSDLYVDSTLSAELAAQIAISSIANAVSVAEGILKTHIYLALDVQSVSSTELALTTSIKLLGSAVSASDFGGGITTQITPVAACVSAATFGSALSTEIHLSASPTALAAFMAPLTTRIALKSDSSAASNLTSSVTAQIKAAAALNANPVFAAELKTSINALTALIGVSNVADASLTVYRVTPSYAPLDNLIYLAELQAYDPTTASVITWQFASGRGYDNAGQFYAPRIEQPANLKRSMGGGVGGRTSLSYGELTLANLDGGINGLADDFLDGRTLTLKRGNPDLPYNTFTTVLVATVESVAMERERASVRLRDKAITLDQPFSTVKYAGTNTNGAGIEGTADDIKGQTKPRIFGRIALMQPIMVNTSKLIYQVNAGAVDNVINVYDAGAYLTRSTDYTSQADMEGNDPASGTWRAWPGGGCIRLGSVPYGQISVCVAEKWGYAQCSAAGLIQRILTEKGYTSANWLASDFVTLNQKNAGSMGVVVSDGETTSALLDRICQSVGAWWGFDSLGRFRVARLDAPAGAAIATLTDNQILEIERQAADQLPVWQTTLKSDINYAKQDKKSLAGVVPANRSNWFEQESRDQKVENAAVKTRRLLAEDQTYDSLLNSISVANAESARRLALFSSRRDTVNITLANPSEYYSSIDLGAVISVQTTKLGYDSGRLMTVTGVSLDYQANTVDITCWG